MENSPIEEQVKSLLKDIMILPFSAKDAVIETEQRLKEIYQENPTLVSVLIALLFCNLVQGKREIALGLSDRIWSEGGKLSDFFELVYADCLLNLGEIEKAHDLLQPRLNNLRENLDYFYMVIVKCALLRGDLFLLMQISDYPDIYQREPDLFDFAKKHALNTSAQSYKELLKIVYTTIKQSLCAVEYAFYDDGVGLLFYTNTYGEQNIRWEQSLSDKTDAYFEENELGEIEGLFINLMNISDHPAWAE